MIFSNLKAVGIYLFYNFMSNASKKKVPVLDLLLKSSIVVY